AFFAPSWNLPDEPLERELVRELIRKAREEFFAGWSKLGLGVGGGVLFLHWGRRALLARKHRNTPMPKERPEDSYLAGKTVAIVGALFAAGIAALACYILLSPG